MNNGMVKKVKDKSRSFFVFFGSDTADDADLYY